MGVIGTFIFLIVAGILAGVVSAVASMASLVSYPALLIAGAPPVMANITNTAALIFTGAGSALSSLEEMKGHWLEAAKYALFILSGACVGSILLLKFPGTVFEKLVPFLVIFSAGMLLLSGSKKFFNLNGEHSRQKVILAYFGMFFAGIYTGYFGAAAGVLNLIFLTYVSEASFVAVNAMKNILGSLGNLVALIVFIIGSKVDRGKAIPLAIGLFIGGYLGQKSIKYLSPSAVRWITAGFSLILASYLFYTAYLA
ncbi:MULTISPECIES: sulfite exporter TauE/SafE family protein [Lactobacillus]|uniref:Probable membrane transporter protein n=1 Tax=Lactobacillus xujianguonis TaxID=2495899 RepID=A0A437SV85_9LACO|nr:MULTISPECIES: sulfite exporter TauE/SafE family protein [Lactobacillus]RVU70838.1 sulfite exporter TauE/SafE family protein [Lactobacillus xujianguonis]RVU77069.1 sulfite exporter TauE/SafE family protein [Lactobacillus xujianguonis]